MMRVIFLIGVLFSMACDSSPGELITRIRSKELREISGMDFSRRHSGIFWVHNDSGDTEELFAVTLEGSVQSQWRVEGVRNEDWEDVALAACLGVPGDCLYVADTGNKHGERKKLRIHMIPEPKVLAPGTLRVTRTFEFPSLGLNIEAMALDEARGRFLLVEKKGKRHSDLRDTGKGRVRMFSLTHGEADLRQITVLDFAAIPDLENEDSLITAADYDPARDVLLLGSYGMSFEIEASKLSEFASSATLRPLPKALKKAEAMAYDGPGIFVTSEGKNPPLYRLAP